MSNQPDTTPHTTPESEWPEPRRPPVAERWTRERTEPVQLLVETCWMYSARGAGSPAHSVEGRPVPHWAFARGAKVLATDVPFWTGQSDMATVASNVSRAIEKFGDDARLIVEVRRAPEQSETPRDSTDSPDSAASTGVVLTESEQRIVTSAVVWWEEHGGNLEEVVSSAVSRIVAGREG